MRTHILSMTLGDKIDAVFDGECGQTIRLIRNDAPWYVGDKIIAHTWAGKPYRSPWARRLDTHVKELRYLYLEKGVGWFESAGPYTRQPIGDMLTEQDLDELARLDFIRPPTASALIHTLMGLNGLNYHQMYEVIS